MNEQYQRLTDTLREIFQMDRADLDFGIYRIMNMKRKEMNDFLETHLLTKVKDTLAAAGAGDTEELQKELNTLENTLIQAGVDVEKNTKVLEMRKAIKAAGSSDALANEVFSHLTAFFLRYYHQGDFISQRRYKKDVYAIPYEGEEVKLHWANHDQYYIKTGEHFRNYSFRTDDGRVISFNLRDAETEKDNNKGKNRLFRLCDDDFISEEDGELKIWFTYESTEKKEKQDDLNKAAINSIISCLPAAFEIGALKPMPTDKKKNRTLLEKHLNEYTARNTSDYFIHKDLGAFLNRELDFYIKNEILHIDDIDLDRPERFDRQLRIIKALKQTARDIIALLAQLENFQKRLWLKKKFVVQSDWCITLDRIPEQFYADIAANTAQREEWVELFAIDGIAPDLTTVPYSEPLTVEFLMANPFLQVDTKFYPREWKYRLLSTIDNLDEHTDGLLINSENFQALNFLHQRYRSSLSAAYIDPPYNTVHSEIVYKNQFKHSSWLSLINNGVPIAKQLLKPTSTFGFAIDDYEFPNLLSYVNMTFSEGWDISVVVVNHHPQGSGGKLSRTHEYYIIASNSESPDLLGISKDDYEEERSFMRAGTAENNYRVGRWRSFYALLVDEKKNKVVGYEKPIPLGEDIPMGKINGFKRIYPINSRGEERVWRSSYETGKKRVEEGEIVLSSNGTVYQVIKHESKREVLFSNWTDSKFNAGVHGSALLKNLGFGGAFDYPKSLNTMETGICAQTFGDTQAIVLDYFGGSGTTGHAVINLNREDGGKRKYILVEMGTYFNTVTKPRMQKVAYSKDWNDGKPVGREGSSNCFKYMRLEGYEDTLNNLRMERSPAQSALLENEHFGHEYNLHYMLGHESRESLLNLDMFKRPFGHTLRIAENNETKEQDVDLVETFNYLIGLVVQSVQYIRGNIVVQGHLLGGEKVLILWRDVELMNNSALDEFFRKLDINTRDTEFKRIYVNGDNNLQNLRTDDETWKVTLIEEEFGKRMFECKEV